MIEIHKREENTNSGDETNHMNNNNNQNNKDSSVGDNSIKYSNIDEMNEFFRKTSPKFHENLSSLIL